MEAFAKSLWAIVFKQKTLISQDASLFKTWGWSYYRIGSKRSQGHTWSVDRHEHYYSKSSNHFYAFINIALRILLFQLCSSENKFQVNFVDQK